MPSSLCRYPEYDVLQKYYAALNGAIESPQIFSSHLIANGFITQQSAANKIKIMGVSDYEKVGDLLGVVDSQLRTAGAVSPEKVTEKFKVFLSILSNPLGLREISEQMEAECCKFIG